MANPRYLFNQSTGIKGSFIILLSLLIAQNRNFCQKTGLINALSRLDATGGLAFSLSEVCPPVASAFWERSINKPRLWQRISILGVLEDNKIIKLFDACTFDWKGSEGGHYTKNFFPTKITPRLWAHVYFYLVMK